MGSRVRVSSRPPTIFESPAIIEIAGLFFVGYGLGYGLNSYAQVGYGLGYGIGFDHVTDFWSDRDSNSQRVNFRSI